MTFLLIKLTNQNQSVQHRNGSQSVASLTMTNRAWGNLENFFEHQMELFEIGFQWIGTIFKIFVQDIVVISEYSAIMSGWKSKVGRVFAMVVVSILPHLEFGPYDHRKDAPLYIKDFFSRKLILIHWRDFDPYYDGMILKNDSRLIIFDQSHLEYFCIILRPNLKNI